jgi:hypothetical protein
VRSLYRSENICRLALPRRANDFNAQAATPELRGTAVITHGLCHFILTDIFRAVAGAKDYRAMRIIKLFCTAGSASIIFSWGEALATLILGRYCCR